MFNTHTNTHTHVYIYIIAMNEWGDDDEKTDLLSPNSQCGRSSPADVSGGEKKYKPQL